MARTMPATLPLFDMPGPVQLDLFAEPADAAPIWVRTCDHAGCVLTSAHKHGGWVEASLASLAAEHGQPPF